ncbi:MAG TPA: bile acid:sodium symporter [Vulgatibacter sp.]|nr:bile acid:sodium symporter [Vulgatibacter sp.]
MREALALTGNIAVVVFTVTSLSTVGFSYRVSRILEPLRNVRQVFRALVCNFVLVPVLAIGIERMIPLDPPLAIGLFLLAGSAGAPFLIKLAQAAKSDIALCAALLLLLVPSTVVFLPFYVPMATADPSLRDLNYTPSSVLAIGAPLLSTLLVPLVLGLVTRAVAPRVAVRLAPVGRKLSTLSLVVAVGSIFGANLPQFVGILKTGAIPAAALLIVGAFLIGFLISRRDTSSVLGLGTAQRNVAAAMVVASQDFDDPGVLVMVTACVLTALAVLFPISWLLSRQRPRVGLPIQGDGPDPVARGA